MPSLYSIFQVQILKVKNSLNGSPLFWGDGGGLASQYSYTQVFFGTATNLPKFLVQDKYDWV